MKDTKKNQILKWLPYLSFLVLCLSVFISPIGNGDEFWNYNFSNCIAKGMIPYKDFSMVQTPLSAYISAIFLLVFGEGMFAHRIAGYILMVSIFSMLFTVCKKILKNSTLAYISTLFCYILNLLCFIYNYNYLSLCIILIVLYLIIGMDEEKENFKLNLIIALLFGLLPIIKQNTGIVLWGLHALFCIADFIFYKKQKISIGRAVASAVPGIIYLLYLIVSESLWWFIDYAVLGIGEFTHRNSMIQYMFTTPVNLVLIAIPLYTILYSVYCIIFKGKRDRKEVFVFLISVAWFASVTFPLCDTAHLFVGLVTLLPMYFMFIKDKQKKLTQVLVCNLLTIFIGIFSIVGFFEGLDQYKISELKHYEGLPISKRLESNIEIIDAYIEQMNKQGSEVYIADEASAAYMIPLGRYKKNWDMLLVGNLGTVTYEELLEVEDNAIFLVIRDEETLGKQSHFELINFIKDNYQKIDEVLLFDVYKKVGTIQSGN